MLKKREFRGAIDHGYQCSLLFRPDDRINLPVAYPRLLLYNGITFADVYTVRYQAAPSTALVTPVVPLTTATQQLVQRSASRSVRPAMPVNPCGAYRNDTITTKSTRDLLWTPQCRASFSRTRDHIASVIFRGRNDAFLRRPLAKRVAC